jgi:hypothetical protein
VLTPQTRLALVDGDVQSTLQAFVFRALPWLVKLHVLRIVA